MSLSVSSVGLDWTNFDGHLFQDLCLDLLSVEGFGVEEGGVGPDGGVDAILLQSNLLPDGSTRIVRWISQIKFKSSPKSTVGPAELGNITNLLFRFGGDGFFLITNGRVTAKTAQELRAVARELRPKPATSIWTGRHIASRLEWNPTIARRYFPAWRPSTKERVPVEIIIAKSFEEFSDLERRLLVHALADFLEISPQAVTIRKVQPGSIKVELMIPAKSADLLEEAFEGGYLDLHSRGFEAEVLRVTVRDRSPRDTLTTNISKTWLNSAERLPIQHYLNETPEETLAALRWVANSLVRTFHLRDQYDADDLAIDTFIRLSESKDDYRATAGEFVAYATKVERRMLVDHSRARHSAKRGGTLSRVTRELDSIAVEEEVELQNTLMVDLHNALQRLGELDPEYAVALELRYIAGFTAEQAGQALGIEPRIFLHRTRTGLRYLRDHLQGSTKPPLKPDG